MHERAPGEHCALLLTDIVDSTQLNDRLGDAGVAASWAEHDRRARTLMRRWRGREVARSDGFLVLFDAAGDAVSFALDYHRVLAALPEPMQARVGVHVGAVQLRENSAADKAQGAPVFEIDGVALPLAARVMSAALGGQTLLSAAARQALGATPLRLVSHGHWRFKGVDEPVELFEVGEPGDDRAPFAPPPDSAKAYRVLRSGELWLPRRQLRHSLPGERDAFVGRQAELGQLASKFDQGARLVSILGTGGSGKTRLATRFGWAWLGDFPGGVWFCDLAPARTPDGMAHAVARGLEVPLGSADPLLQLSRAIAGRGPCLVLLDNFEQVARHAGDILGPWLERAPEARFLVTTREVLGLAGETVLNLAPLPAGDSAALFLRRAEAAWSGFDPGADDRAAIDPLVRLLDGLPLAIELAAVRVRLMTPRTLLQRMRERFKLLAAGGARDDRQATLRGAFDWSWDLLAPAEKSALAQLSVFEGGFTLAAAEAVLALPGPDAPWIVDVVQALVEKSLLRRASEQRFDLLQSVQDYAAEHLRTPGRFDGSGPAALAAAQQRHWQHFAAFDEAAALADGGADADNLAAACRRAAADGDGEAAAGALAALWPALRMTGPFRAAIELAGLVDALPDLGERHRAAVDWVTGSAAYLVGDAALAQARLRAGLARAGSDSTIEVNLLRAWAEVLMTAGQVDEAGRALRRALVLARESADPSLEFKALNGLGALDLECARPDQARQHYESALALAHRLGDQRWEGGLLSNLGAVHQGEGRLDEAERHYARALNLVRSVGDRRWEGNARCNLALLHHEQGRHEQAREQFEAALTMARSMGHMRLQATVLCNLGLVNEALGQTQLALQQHEGAVAAAAALSDRRSEGQFRGCLGLLYAKLGRHAEARHCLDLGEAQLRAGPDALSLGVLLCQSARAEHAAGEPDAARATLGRAASIQRQQAAAGASELGRALDLARRECGVAAGDGAAGLSRPC